MSSGRSGGMPLPGRAKVGTCHAKKHGYYAFYEGVKGEVADW